MTLSEVLKSVEKTYGKSSVQQGVELKDINRLKLPARALNKMLYGGLPRGRLIEFSGAEHSGKTTTALLAVAACQRENPESKCIFVDAEGTYDAVWADKLGVNNDTVIKITPENMTAEQVLQMIVDITSTGEVSLIVLDSIPALVPQQEDAKSIKEYTMAGVSKPLTVFCRKVQKELIKFPDVICIAINQLRDNLSGYGSSTNTPGGKMWKAACSLRLEFRGNNIDEDGKDLSGTANNVAGAKIQASLIKNKTAPRDRRVGSYCVMFQTGFNEKKDVIQQALDLGIIEQAQAWTRYPDENGEVIYKGNGMAAFINDMPDNIYEEIRRKVDGE